MFFSVLIFHVDKQRVPPRMRVEVGLPLGPPPMSPPVTHASATPPATPTMLPRPPATTTATTRWCSWCSRQGHELRECWSKPRGGKGCGKGFTKGKGFAKGKGQWYDKYHYHPYRKVTVPETDTKRESKADLTAPSGRNIILHFH